MFLVPKNAVRPWRQRRSLFLSVTGFYYKSCYLIPF
jgi:hypothetical protein